MKQSCKVNAKKCLEQNNGRSYVYMICKVNMRKNRFILRAQIIS